MSSTQNFEEYILNTYNACASFLILMTQLQLATRYPWVPRGPPEGDATALNSKCDHAVNILSTRSENTGHI